MKTVAFTAETNDGYRFLGSEVCRRFQELNDIECRMLTADNFNFSKLRSPHWVKLFLWNEADPDVERIIWLDVDVVLLRPIGALPDAPFAAVHDEYSSFRHCKSMSEKVQALSKFFNTGFFVATRATEPVFEAAQKDMWEEPGLAGAHGERACLNLKVAQMLGGWEELRPIYNWLPSNGYPGGDCIMVHYAGGSAEKHHVSATILRLLQHEKRRLSGTDHP